MNKGKVYLVGAGPSGIDYITVKGLRLIQSADTIIHDYLVDQELLAEARPEAEKISCDRLGKKSHGQEGSEAQEAINALVVEKAKEGRMVVRLKNGDPMIFSRITEEIAALKEQGIPYEIVPGITAAQAASAITKVPLTDRKISSSVVFVTGHESADKNQTTTDWKSIATNGTIVLYMAVRNIRAISVKLISFGKPATTPVLAISHVGRERQMIFRAQLSELAAMVDANKIITPAIFIIGETAALR